MGPAAGPAVELTQEQDRAVELLATRLRKGAPLSTLFGHAGTGKTTTARHIAARVAARVAFCAPTGKAALVLRNKGVPATTVHSLIYRAVGDSRKELDRLSKLLAKERSKAKQEELRERIQTLLGILSSPTFVLQEELAEKVEAIILDEASMVSEQLLADLMSFGIPVLALGDPAQLPPVKAVSPLAGEDYKPTVLLTQPHRFALDSSVHYFATRVRERGPRGVDSWREGSGLNYVDSFAPTVEMAEKLLEYDQVICGRNATRLRLNTALRAVLGRAPDDLDDADRLVCLRNEPKLGLINGEQYTVAQLAAADVPEADLMQIEGFSHLPLFGFAYAITAHKSQGSEWPRVVVFDESSAFGRDATKWLYTAITRAADEVVVLRQK